VQDSTIDRDFALFQDAPILNLSYPNDRWRLRVLESPAFDIASTTARAIRTSARA